MAYLVDLLKAIHSRHARVSDEELLGHGLWGIGGQIIRCNAYPADLNDLGYSDLAMKNTIILLPLASKISLLCALCRKKESRKLRLT